MATLTDAEQLRYGYKFALLSLVLFPRPWMGSCRFEQQDDSSTDFTRRADISLRSQPGEAPGVDSKRPFAAWLTHTAAQTIKSIETYHELSTPCHP